MIQKSLVLLKPDAVKRGIMGEFLHRFERAGLKVVGAKLINADLEKAKIHYKKDEAWHKKIGDINKKDCEKFGIDIKSVFGTEDSVEIGRQINENLYHMLLVGPIFAMVLEGANAVDKIRTLVGSTYPETAMPGTIRGDFGLDSAYSGMIRKRSTYNLVHASGTVAEAEEEIKLWFKPEEILDYRRVHEDLYKY